MSLPELARHPRAAGRHRGGDLLGSFQRLVRAGRSTSEDLGALSHARGNLLRTTLSAVGLPAAWLDAWEAALDESDAALRDAERSRLAQSQHVGLGQDAEADFVDLAIRLRRYVESRASRNDKARIAEGKQLLAPLSSAVKKLGAERQARATRRDNAGQTSRPVGHGQDAPA